LLNCRFHRPKRQPILQDFATGQPALPDQQRIDRFEGSFGQIPLTLEFSSAVGAQLHCARPWQTQPIRSSEALFTRGHESGEKP
jgi:hypothetical protein